MIVFHYRIRITVQAFVIQMKAVFKNLPERLFIVLYTPRITQSYQLSHDALSNQRHMRAILPLLAA